MQEGGGTAQAARTGAGAPATGRETEPSPHSPKAGATGCGAAGQVPESGEVRGTGQQVATGHQAIGRSERSEVEQGSRELLAGGDGLVQAAVDRIQGS